MEKLKINIVIAGRTYHLNIRNEKEEEAMRKAANTINKLISTYEQNYAVSDKQEVLAMCALHFASKLEISTLDDDSESIETINKLKELTNLVNSHL